MLKQIKLSRKKGLPDEIGKNASQYKKDLFRFFSPTPEVIEVIFHELLAFDLFFFATLSLGISFLKISQESHLYFIHTGNCN